MSLQRTVLKFRFPNPRLNVVLEEYKRRMNNLQDAIDAIAPTVNVNSISEYRDYSTNWGIAFIHSDGSTGVDHTYIDQDVTTTASPTFVTVKLTSLGDGYVPYHVNDATGLADSDISYDGTNVSMFASATSGDNPLLNIYGYITAGTAARYTSMTMDDTNDEFLIQTENNANHEGITVDLTETNQRFRIRQNSDSVSMYLDGTDVYTRWSDGNFIFQTDEGTDTNTVIRFLPKGNADAGMELWDRDENTRARLYQTTGATVLESARPVTSGNNDPLHLNPTNPQGVYCFTSAPAGPQFRVHGYVGGENTFGYLRQLSDGGFEVSTSDNSYNLSLSSGGTSVIDIGYISGTSYYARVEENQILTFGSDRDYSIGYHTDDGRLLFMIGSTIRSNTFASMDSNGMWGFEGHVSIYHGTEVRFFDVGDSNYVGFKAPALTATQIWALPAIDGSVNEAMGTDGSGNLIWRTHDELADFTQTEHFTMLDEDNMASNSNTQAATQQSIVAYVGTAAGSENLGFAGDSGTGNVNLNTQTFTVSGTANRITTSASGQTLIITGPQDIHTGASPTFNALSLATNVTFTGATTENLIKMPDNLLDALSIQEGSNKYVTFDTVDDEEDILFYKSVDILHTSTHADDHALEIDTDAAGYGDVKAIDIDYITGNITAGEDEGILLLNIDRTLATGGDIFALEVLATDQVSGSTGIYGLKIGPEIGPVHQDSGIFINPTLATNDTPTTHVPVMADGILANTTAIFSANADYIIIGADAAFQDIELIFSTPASKNIRPTFWYSIAGIDTFTEFTPVDGTDGCRHTGVISWDASDVTNHVADTTTGKFDIKIIRTKGGSMTTPVLGYAKTATTTEYVWDKSGDVSINNLALAGNLTSVGTIATPTAITMSDNGTIGCTGAPVLTFDDTNNWLELDSPLGIGTATVPHGGVGWAKLAIDGTSGNVAGPHIQMTVSTDAFPTMQILNYRHDDISIRFDSYWDGQNKSSDAGSNYSIHKVSDLFKIMYDSGITAGNVLAWNTGISLNTSGLVTIPGTMAAGTVTGANVTTGADPGHTHEGANIKSTGEGGSSKFLREDGDNSCSWQTVSAGGGVVAQVVTDTNGTEETLGTGFPNDDTIPQRSEGDEILSCAITPQNASSTILVFYNTMLQHSGGTSATIACLFISSSNDTLGVNRSASSGSINSGCFVVAAGSTNARTYSIRVGNSTGNNIITNMAGANLWSTAEVSSMIVMEILP